MGPQNGGYRCVVRPQGRLKPRPYGRRKMAHNPSTTIRHRTYRRMERFDLIYFEQPVEGISRLAEVARAIDAPVMADESAWNAHDVIEIIDKPRHRSSRFIRPSPVAFIAPWKLPRLRERFQVPIQPRARA